MSTRRRCLTPALEACTLRLAIVPRALVHALKAIDRKRPTAAGKDRQVGLTATADGLTLDTNASTAFVPAHVAVAGACAVRRDWLLKILQTYPQDQPLTLAVVDGRLEMGRLKIPCSTHFGGRTHQTGSTHEEDGR